MFALAIGVLLWLLFLAVWYGVAWLLRRRPGGTGPRLASGGSVTASRS
jgi:hypothetical protein